MTTDHHIHPDALELAALLEETWPAAHDALVASGVPLMDGYDNVISRSDVAALIPEEVAAKVMEGTVRRSAVLSQLPRVTMSRAQMRIPVISALPMAYFVNGDTGLKKTTEQNWSNKYLNVEEIAAIVPIPENVLDDSDFDAWGSIQPRLEEAIGRALDAAVFFGVNKPASWPTDIVAAATAAGNTAVRGTNAAAAGGIVGDLGDALSTAEADGYDPTDGVANRTLKGFARKARATTGERLQDDIVIKKDQVTIDGVDYLLPMRGLWPTGSGAATAIMWDPTEFMLGVRQDFTYKILTEAAIFDDGGNLMYNLPQQDMVALRVVARYAWQVANVLNFDNPNEATRYPAAVLKEA